MSYGHLYTYDFRLIVFSHMCICYTTDVENKAFLFKVTAWDACVVCYNYSLQRMKSCVFRNQYRSTYMYNGGLLITTFIVMSRLKIKQLYHRMHLICDCIRILQLRLLLLKILDMYHYLQHRLEFLQQFPLGNRDTVSLSSK